MIEQTPNPLETASWNTRELRVAVHIVGILAELRNPEEEVVPTLSPDQLQHYGLAIDPEVTAKELHSSLGGDSSEVRNRLSSLLDTLAEAANFPDKRPARAKEMRTVRILAGLAIQESPRVHPPTEKLVDILSDAIPALNHTRPMIAELQDATVQPVGRQIAALLAARGITQTKAAQKLLENGGPSGSTFIRFLSGRTHSLASAVLNPALEFLLPDLPEEEVAEIRAAYRRERDRKIKEPRRGKSGPRGPRRTN